MKQYMRGSLRKAEGLLKHPYISPGSTYEASQWDWDCYWAMFAFLEYADQADDESLKAEIAPFARGSLFNMLEHQYDDGSISIEMNPVEDDFFECHLPDNNMAKPFVGQIAHLLWKHGLLSLDELNLVLPKITKFHRCYETRYTHVPTGLLFFATDLGIGVDDDPATWGRPPKSSGSIFLNSFYYRDLIQTSELYQAIGQYNSWTADKASQIADSIRKFCYDKREKSFFTVDLLCQHNLIIADDGTHLNAGLEPFWKVLQLKVLVWSTMLPLWMGLGTQQQVDDYVREHFVPERLLSPFGLRSLSADEPMYAPEVTRGNPSNWLGPVWILENYIALDILCRYGHQAEADDLKTRVLKLVNDDISATGSLHEYYSPETGVPLNNPGLLSWNALILLF